MKKSPRRSAAAAGLALLLAFGASTAVAGCSDEPGEDVIGDGEINDSED